MRILLVEDNADLADAIVRRMRRDGHALDWQSDGLKAASVLRYQSFDLIVLDIGLPRLSGLGLLAGLRERGDATPVLMLTARDGIEDRVQALDAGADDYLAKPFDFREFEARCRVLLRRNRGQASAIVQIGGFAFDSGAHRVSLDGDAIELPNREFRLQSGENAEGGPLARPPFGSGFQTRISGTSPRRRSCPVRSGCRS